MPNCQYTDFDITILGSDPPYTVSARFGDQSADGLFMEQIDDPYWQETVTRMGAVHAHPDSAYFHAAGARLFDGLISGDVQLLWTRAEAMTDGQGLRLRLAIQPPPVAALPWEALYDSARGRFFAASGRTPLIRMETQSRRLPVPRRHENSLPLRVLLAAAEDAHGLIDVDLQRHQVAQTLRTLPETDVRVHELMGRFNVIELAQAVIDHDADVLHLISHGQPDGLLLWQDDESVFVKSSALCRALERASTLRLVYLSACLAGRASAHAAFTTVGPQLLQLGIPAVVAMQFLVSDRDAAKFSVLFYQELLTGSCPGAVDVAMGYARASQYALDPDGFSFGTPVLWLSRSDTTIAQFGAAQATHLPASVPTAAPDDEPSIPTQEALLMWLDQQAPVVDVTTLPLTLRRQWPRLMQEYRDLVHQLPAATDQQEKYREITALQERLLRLAAQIRAHGDPAGSAPDDKT